MIDFPQINRASSTFCVCILLLTGLTSSAAAEVRLPRIFSQHMVVQQRMEIPVWGWAAPGEKIIAELAGSRAQTVADAKGSWSLRLPPLTAGGPHILSVTGATQNLSVTDVLVGEVWVASGQSWMTWDVARADHAEREIQDAKHPSIRMFNMPETVALTPLSDGSGKWEVCTPQSVRIFSACGYFFARHLHQKLGVPIGILHASVPGTGLWAWTSREVFERDATLQKRLESFDTAISQFGTKFHERYGSSIQAWVDARTSAPAGAKIPFPPEVFVHQRPLPEWQAWLARARECVANNQPVPLPPEIQPYPTADPRNSSRLPSTVLFNGMIQPLIPYGIAGFIWYQGGSEGPAAYRTLFPLMIQDWRHKWGQGNVPFLFVQRPNANEKVSGAGPELADFRDAQAAALTLPNTGMAVAIDIGLPDDLHPTNMQDAGRRLALLAEKIAYNRDVVSSGPTFKNLTREGHKLRIQFTHIGGGLVARGNDRLLGFEIAGKDGKYHPAEAVIDGTSVVVGSNEVAEPISVRYAWAANPTCNLYNIQQLPAPPFRAVLTSN